MQWNQKLWQRSIEQFAEFLESLAAVAYLFMLVIYLRSKKNLWCYVGEGTARAAALAGAAGRTLPLLQAPFPRPPLDST